MGKPLSRTARYVWDSLHFVTAVGWLGVAFCQLCLNVTSATSDDAGVHAAAHDLAHAFDRYVLVPLALGALVSGVVRAVRSRWGLVSHWWVTVKFAATIALMVFDSVWLGEWNVRARALAGTSAGSGQGAYDVLGEWLLAGSVINIALLTFMTVISVIKPWGRTPFHRPAGAPGRR